jgi:DNA-binding HxlR family transcriptional regulator
MRPGVPIAGRLAGARLYYGRFGSSRATHFVAMAGTRKTRAGRSTALRAPRRRVRAALGGGPILSLLDALGRRWALRVLWELREVDASLTFRALQAACGGVSPTVLNERLRELRELGVIVPQAGGYALSRAGRALAKPLSGVHAWAERHMRGHARAPR